MSQIYLADDSPTVQRILKLTLETAAYDIVLGSSQQELEYFLDKQNPDLVFLDVHLVDSVKNFLKKYSHIKWFLIIDEFDEYVLTELAPYGVIDFLSRPFQPQKVLEMVQNALMFSKEKYQAPLLEEEDLAFPSKIIDLFPKERIPEIITEQKNILSFHKDAENFDKNKDLLLEQDIEKIIRKILPSILDDLLRK